MYTFSRSVMFPDGISEIFYTEIIVLVTIPLLLLVTEGDGLGKNRNGEVNPLTLDIKQDKRGLIASDEAVGKKGRAALQMTAVDLSGVFYKVFSLKMHFYWLPQEKPVSKRPLWQLGADLQPVRSLQQGTATKSKQKQLSNKK